jgi:signal transduction histidine kinase
VTRRLTFAILGTVVASLVLTGVATLVLTRWNAREEAETEARAQVEVVAVLLDLASDSVEGRVSLREQIDTVRPRLQVRDIEILVFGPQGRIIAELSSEMPEGVEVTDLDIEALRAGNTVSGSERGLVYAAAPITAISDARRPVPNGEGSVDLNLTGAVVITQEPDQLFAPSTRWFLWASTFTLLIGTAVAVWLGRRLGEPVNEATRATHQIATGDLEARVPVHRDRGSELADLATSINTMAKELQRGRGLEQQFLLSVSHDLRTPLTSITGYAEAIADGAAPDDKAAAAIIQQEARRLERLVADLLQLARLDAAGFRLDLRPVDLGELAARGAEGFRRQLDGAGLALEVDCPEDVWVEGDSDRLAQVVANLVENAMKYASGRVRVAVHTTADSAVLRVSDDGPGIAPDDLPHVFERLYVAQRQPVRRESGSGLGLAIVRELVTAMGGHVSARMEQPHGTCMEVILPRTPGR